MGLRHPSSASRREGEVNKHGGRHDLFDQREELSFFQPDMGLEALPHLEHDAGADPGAPEIQAQPPDEAVDLDVLDQNLLEKVRHRRRDLDEQGKEQLFLLPEMGYRLGFEEFDEGRGGIPRCAASPVAAVRSLRACASAW